MVTRTVRPAAGPGAAAETLEGEIRSIADKRLMPYMARVLAYCTLPRRRSEANESTRRNARFALSIVARNAYRRYPRLPLCCVSTEAVRIGRPRIELLAEQLGHRYARLCDFRKGLIRPLRHVERHDDAGAIPTASGLLLQPRPPHVLQRKSP